MLKLIQTYIENCDNLTIFNERFLPSLQTLVSDY